MDLKSSAFRLWVHQIWLENCEERQIWRTGDPMTAQEYFGKFRWWLRREWRHQQRKQQSKRH
jgi:hypothetical protein